MPNWTTTIIQSKDLKGLKTEAGERLFPDRGRIVDFDKLIPMPEELAVVSSPPEENVVLAYLTDGFKEPVDDTVTQKVLDICHGHYTFHTFEEYKQRYEEMAKEEDPNKEVSLSFTIDGPTEMVSAFEKGRRYVDNYKKYDAPTWYEWAVKNWGTKWNARCDSEWCSEDIICLQTAWSPPVGFFCAMAEAYPDLDANLIWCDEDYGSGCGVAVIKDGKINGKWLDPCSVDAYRVAIYLIGEAFWIGEDEDEESILSNDAYTTAVDNPITDETLGEEISRMIG